MKAACAAAGFLLLTTASATEAANRSVAEEELEAANASYQQAVIGAEHAVAKAESLAAQFKNVYRNDTLVQAFAADIQERVRLEAEAKNLSLEKQAEALKEMYYSNRSAHKMLAHQLEKEAKRAGRAVVKSGREVEHAAKKAKRKEREYERDYERAERTGERLEERGERAGEFAEDSVERLYERVERRVEQKAHELRAQAREALEAAKKASEEKLKEAKADAKQVRKELNDDRKQARKADQEAEKEGKAEAKAATTASEKSATTEAKAADEEKNAADVSADAKAATTASEKNATTEARAADEEKNAADVSKKPEASKASAFLASARAQPSGTAMDLLAIMVSALMALAMLAAGGLRCRSGSLSGRGVVLDAPALG